MTVPVLSGKGAVSGPDFPVLLFHSVAVGHIQSQQIKYRNYVSIYMGKVLSTQGWFT